MNKIILSSVLALFLVACSDQKTEQKQVNNEVQEEKVLSQKEIAEAKAAIQETLEEKQAPTEAVETQTASEIKEAAALANEEVQEAATAVSKALDSTEPPTEELETATKTEIEAAKELAKEETAQATEAVKEVVAPAVEEVPQEMTTVADGKKLFIKCAGCHGMNGEKHALGKSQIIKGWSVEKVETALKGYKDGTYGGASKSFMKAQVANLSDADIKALAEYISQL
jgi:cytochrome c553